MTNNQQPAAWVAISLRDYFAAHAPMPIPDWFKGEYAGDMPGIPDVPATWGAAQAAQFCDLKDGTILPPAAAPEVAAFYAVWEAKKAAHAAWRDRQRERKYFAWRWHYADMMIAGRAA